MGCYRLTLGPLRNGINRANSRVMPVIPNRINHFLG